MSLMSYRNAHLLLGVVVGVALVAAAVCVSVACLVPNEHCAGEEQDAIGAALAMPRMLLTALVVSVMPLLALSVIGRERAFFAPALVMAAPTRAPLRI